MFKYKKKTTNENLDALIIFTYLYYFIISESQLKTWAVM